MTDFNPSQFDAVAYVKDIEDRKRGLDKKKVEPRVLKEKDQQATFDTGVYGVNVKSETAAVQPKGLPRGKVFAKREDFTT